MSFLDIITGQKIIVMSVWIAILPLLIAAILILVGRIRQWQAASPTVQVAEIPEAVEETFVEQPAVAQQFTKLPLTAQPSSTEEKSEEPAVSSEMQALLSSVFVDEEATARYQVLLEGAKAIPASELLILCRQVASQVGG